MRMFKLVRSIEYALTRNRQEIAMGKLRGRLAVPLTVQER